MNARIGNELDYIIDDNVKYLPNVHWYNVSNFSKVRRSKDEIVNKFGRTFLELCKEIGIYVLNGRKGKDIPGDFTYNYMLSGAKCDRLYCRRREHI